MRYPDQQCGHSKGIGALKRLATFIPSSYRRVQRLERNHLRISHEACARAHATNQIAVRGGSLGIEEFHPRDHTLASESTTKFRFTPTTRNSILPRTTIPRFERMAKHLAGSGSKLASSNDLLLLSGPGRT